MFTKDFIPDYIYESSFAVLIIEEIKEASGTYSMPIFNT